MRTIPPTTHATPMSSPSARVVCSGARRHSSPTVIDSVPSTNESPRSPAPVAAEAAATICRTPAASSWTLNRQATTVAVAPGQVSRTTPTTMPSAPSATTRTGERPASASRTTAESARGATAGGTRMVPPAGREPRVPPRVDGAPRPAQVIHSRPRAGSDPPLRGEPGDRLRSYRRSMRTPATDGPASPPIDGPAVHASATPKPRESPSPGTPSRDAPPLEGRSSREDPPETPPPAPPAQGRPVLPRSLVMLLGAGSAVLVLAGIQAVAWLIGPAFLALMIVIAISPVQSALLRHGWPAWLSTLVLVLLVVGVLVLFGLVFVVSTARLAALLPQYADQADKTLQSLASSLQSFGVDPDQLKQAVSSINPSKLVALIGTVLAGLSGAATSLVFLLCLMLFLSIEAGGVDLRLAATAVDRPQLERALRSFAAGTRSYLVVTAIFGLIVGVLDGGALWIIGVPLPVLWGLLSFLTNFIPNVGFLIGLVPPALLALLTGGVSEMLLVIGVYCLLNFVIQTVIQPRFVGDSVGLAMTTTFVALVFWAWLLGPIGALLAIPLTLLVKALLVDVDPTARWATALAGSLERPPRAPREHRRRRHAPSGDLAAAGAGHPAR